MAARRAIRGRRSASRRASPAAASSAGSTAAASRPAPRPSRPRATRRRASTRSTSGPLTGPATWARPPRGRGRSTLRSTCGSRPASPPGSVTNKRSPGFRFTSSDRSPGSDAAWTARAICSTAAPRRRPSRTRRPRRWKTASTCSASRRSTGPTRARSSRGPSGSTRGPEGHDLIRARADGSASSDPSPSFSFSSDERKLALPMQAGRAPVLAVLLAALDRPPERRGPQFGVRAIDAAGNRSARDGSSSRSTPWRPG